MTPNELQNALNDAIALEEALSGRDGGVTSSGVNLTSEYVYGLLPDAVIRNNAKQNMNSFSSNINQLLSDKTIIGNLGPNWKANLATLESLANKTQREYVDKYKVRIGRVGDEDLQEANKYETIPQFLGGRDWRQSMPTIGTQTPPNIQSLLNKYPPQG